MGTEMGNVALDDGTMRLHRGFVPQASEPEKLRRWSVLVVEKNDRHRTALTQELEDEGFDVVKAADAREGIRMAVEHKPHVIIADPAELSNRSHAAIRQTPFIAFSVKSTPAKEAAALDMGYFDVIYKPLNRIRLLTRVYRVLRLAYTV